MPRNNAENKGMSGPDPDAREKKLPKRKQIVLRLPESLWNDIAGWAEDDFRSINGQIEYLLTKSVREHRKNK